MSPDDPPVQRHGTLPGDDGALLSSYLDGELDATETARLERRLDTDPGLARRLDAMADTLVALRRLDDVDVPHGFSQRLDERLRGEAGGPADDLARRRARRADGRRRTLAALSGIAAALAVLAVMTVGGFPGSGQDTAEMALEADAEGGADGADSSAMTALGEDATNPEADGGGQPQQEAAAPRPEVDAHADATEAAGSAETPRAQSRGESGGEEGGGDAETQRPAAASAASPPSLVDAGLVLADEEQLRAAYRGLPEAGEALGMRTAAAQERAAANSEVIRAAPPLPDSGLAPGTCLEAVTGAQQEEPVVPVRVEALRYRGQQSLAYVLVTASAGASALDRAEVRVVDPVSCVTRQLLELPPG